jgi:hypothetical protein
MIGWNLGYGSFTVNSVISKQYSSNPIFLKVSDDIWLKFPKGDCITLDTSIKKAQGYLSEVFLEKAGNISDNNRKEYINKMAEILPKYLQELEAEFNNKKCRDEFEKIRIQDMASTLTKGASKQEVSILNPNFKEQYIYIGIGAVVLLLGLYVVTKK